MNRKLLWCNGSLSGIIFTEMTSNKKQNQPKTTLFSFLKHPTPTNKNCSYISKVILVHGSVQALIAVHATLVQMFWKLAGDTVEGLRECMMTRTQTAVLVTAGSVHGVLLHFRVSLYHLLQVPLYLTVLGVQINVLYFGAGVYGVTGIVYCFVLRHGGYIGGNISHFVFIKST